MIYKGIKTREISFPLGGIGAGCIGLAGNGRLIDWEIFNRPAKLSFNGMSHFAVRCEKNDKVIDARIMQGDLQPPYTGIYCEKLFNGFGWGPSRSNLCGMPHFRYCEFSGEFPVAQLSFEDADFPGKARLCAWSPTIPGNAEDSSIPAACFEIELTNTQQKVLDYTIIGVVSNPFTHKGSENLYRQIDGKHQLCLNSGLSTDDFDYGELCLSTDFIDTSCQEYWYRGRWQDDLEVYWNDMLTPGRFCPRNYAVRKTEGGKQDTGLLATYIRLAPGASQKICFVLSWHVPNRKNDWNSNADKMAAKNGLKNRWRNWYATQWESACSSGAYMIERYQQLRDETFCFHDTLFASSLPKEVIDGVSSNISILKSPTCLRLEDGTFYGWEGVGATQGSCEGSCTHVWNYAQALPFLFPDLERSMRESHYKFSQDKNGGCHFRIMLPLGIKADTQSIRPCVDGQLGDVMKSYRDWKISGDDLWLKQCWSAIKKSIEYVWSPDNYDKWDPKRTGVISGRQHHTLDMELFGPNAWLNGHYLGALKAGAEMADAVGEADFAATCQAIFEKGKKWTDEKLFNGEYYFQQIDLADKSLLESFNRDEDNCATEIYWSEECGEMKYQIGEGCSIDMHLAQWYASLYGIGDILDREQVKKTLCAIYKYNYKQNMRKEVNTWRNYALNDEGGVLICTWPRKVHKPVIPIPYASETMHGFEWAVACHMIMNNMIEKGMEIIKSIRSRYDGEKRNPWNEFECGSNYARSMASYALLNAFSGFRFDLTRGMIGFMPLLQNQDFRCFWSLGCVWGEFVRSDKNDRICFHYGSVVLRELILEAGIKAIEYRGVQQKFKVIDKRLKLANPVKISSGDELVIMH
jgi:uncharacterized protein (DUF608 family)